MNGVLIFVGIVFIIAAIIGYAQGLIKMVASLLATIIMIALVMLLTPHVSKLIRQVTPLEDTVQKKMSEMIMSETGGEAVDENVEIPREQQIALIENAELPQVLQKMLLENNNVEAYVTLGVETFTDYIGAYIAKIIADVIAFLIVFLLVSIAVPILIKVFDLVNKLPVIGGMNRIAGGVLGLGIGLAVVWVFFIIVTLAYSTGFGKACFACIEESVFLAKLYDGNILLNAITKF